MKMTDIRDVHIKIRKKYPPSEMSPEMLHEIVQILFEYLDDNQPERSKREDSIPE